MDELFVRYVVIDDVLTADGVLETDGGNPLSGKTITMYTDSTEIGSTTTASDGSYSVSASVGSTQQAFIFKVRFVGDSSYDPSEKTNSITVETRTPILTLNIPSAVALGTDFAWSGSLYDPRTGLGSTLDSRPIILQMDDGTGTFIDVAGPVNTDGNGDYSGTHTAPATLGTYTFQTHFPGDSPPAYSDPLVVTVKDLNFLDYVSLYAEGNPQLCGLIVAAIAVAIAVPIVLRRIGKI